MQPETAHPLEFERLTRPEEWCRAYRQRNLPAYTDYCGLVHVWAGVEIAAIHMPIMLGKQVQSWLRQHLYTGPILARPARDRPHRYTFLCHPNLVPRSYTVTELTSVGAGICAPGTPIMLPTSVVRDLHECRWVQQPQPGRELPPLSAVIRGVRICATPVR